MRSVGRVGDSDAVKSPDTPSLTASQSFPPREAEGR
jgi:hypothetical protein